MSITDINFKEVVSAFLVLFAIIDIIGSIPIVVKLLDNTGHIESGKASIVAGILMILFLFSGEFLLSLLGIDVYSFAVAGSLVIFFIALEMILGIQLYKQSDLGTASIIPLAFPLIAGSGTLTSILSLKAEYQTINILIAIILNIIIVFIILKLVGKISAFLGARGIELIQKIFGIILLSIAVKLFTSNINNLLG